MVRPPMAAGTPVPDRASPPTAAGTVPPLKAPRSHDAAALPAPASLPSAMASSTSWLPARSPTTSIAAMGLAGCGLSQPML